MNYIKYLYNWYKDYGFTKKSPVHGFGKLVWGGEYIQGPRTFYKAERERQYWMQVGRAASKRPSKSTYTLTHHQHKG